MNDLIQYYPYMLFVANFPIGLIITLSVTENRLYCLLLLIPFGWVVLINKL